MAADFMMRLEAAGHNVVETSITYGGEDVIRRDGQYDMEIRKRTPTEYLAERDATRSSISVGTPSSTPQGLVAFWQLDSGRAKRAI